MPRRDDTGIVEHQQVAGIELVQHIDKMTVAQGAGLTIELQQAAGGPLRHRIAGNQLVWQIKMKIGYCIFHLGESAASLVIPLLQGNQRPKPKADKG